MSQAPVPQTRMSSARVTARGYLTAGVATLGAGAMALSAVQPMPSQAAPLQQRVVSDMAVGLAAAVDPIQAWVNVFETSAANIETLGKLNEQNPFPLLKTLGANVQTYAGELGNGQGNLIPGQIWNNIQTFFQAPWDPGDGIEIPYSDGPQFMPSGEYASSYSGGGQTPVGVTSVVQLEAAVQFFELDCEAKDNCSYQPLVPVVRFLNTHYSGQLVALVGTLISPVVQLVKSFTAIGQYFQDGEVLDAVYELINIPANMTNAALNGAGVLDLTPIVDAIVPDSPLDKVGINLGGLLNAMPQNGDRTRPPTEWSGGVGIDGLSIGSPGDFAYASGIPNGLLGANIGMGQFLAEQLLVTPPDPEEAAAPAAAAPAPAAAVAEESVPVVEEDLAEPASVVEDNAKAESASAPKAAAATGDASDGNTGRAARGGRGAR